MRFSLNHVVTPKGSQTSRFTAASAALPHGPPRAWCLTVHGQNFPGFKQHELLAVAAVRHHGCSFVHAYTPHVIWNFRLSSTKHVCQALALTTASHGRRLSCTSSVPALCSGVGAFADKVVFTCFTRGRSAEAESSTQSQS